MKIVFTGTHGTGKTTLVNEIVKMYPEYKLMPNIRRELKKVFDIDINEGTSYEMQYTNMLFHMFHVSYHEDLISERSIIDYIAYTQASSNISDEDKKKYYNKFKDMTKFENIIFYTPIEFDMEPDDARSNDADYRYKVDQYIKEFLINNCVQYVTLKGTVEERIAKIKDVLKMES